MAYLGNIYCQSVMVAFIFDRIIMGKSVMAFICDRITMGKIINIISHNVKPAAHKSFYNLATMAVKGNTDNKFIFLPSTIVQQDKNQNLVLVLSFFAQQIRSWPLGKEKKHRPKYNRKTKLIAPRVKFQFDNSVAYLSIVTKRGVETH